MESETAGEVMKQREKKDNSSKKKMERREEPPPLSSRKCLHSDLGAYFL